MPANRRGDANTVMSRDSGGSPAGSPATVMRAAVSTSKACQSTVPPSNEGARNTICLSPAPTRSAKRYSKLFEIQESSLGSITGETFVRYQESHLFEAS